MRKYEAMFIFKPDLNENDRTQLFNQVKDVLQKAQVRILSANIWAEKRQLFFDLIIKGTPTKFKDALYYLVEFESEPAQIQKINSAYRLNENIMRFLISLKEEK